MILSRLPQAHWKTPFSGTSPKRGSYSCLQDGQHVFPFRQGATPLPDGFAHRAKEDGKPEPSCAPSSVPRSSNLEVIGAVRTI